MKTIKEKDLDGNDVTVTVNMPSRRIYDEAAIEYSKAFNKYITEGIMTRNQMETKFKTDFGENDPKLREIEGRVREATEVLQKGGIPLKKAREIALDLRKARKEYVDYLSGQTSYSEHCAENLASNDRFDFFVIKCICKEDGKTQVWNAVSEYDKDSLQPWANKAASVLANMLYGLQEDYEKSLPENEFLVKYNFAGEDLRLKNSDGHLIDEDGRLLDQEGRYIAYDDKGESYFVDRDGERLEKDIEFSPFLDDDGNPVGEEKPKKPRRRRASTAKKKEEVSN